MKRRPPTFLESLLFDGSGQTCHLVIDAATSPWPHTLVEDVLREGLGLLDHGDGSLLLARLEPEHRLVRRLAEEAWGQQSGVFLRHEATCSTEALADHLRTLLLVRDPAGETMALRFESPRVMRALLPACAASELRAIFGPIRSMIMESQTPNEALIFRMGPDSRLETIRRERFAAAA